MPFIKKVKINAHECKIKDQATNLKKNSQEMTFTAK